MSPCQLFLMRQWKRSHLAFEDVSVSTQTGDAIDEPAETEGYDGEEEAGDERAGHHEVYSCRLWLWIEAERHWGDDKARDKTQGDEDGEGKENVGARSDLVAPIPHLSYSVGHEPQVELKAKKFDFRKVTFSSHASHFQANCRYC